MDNLHYFTYVTENLVNGKRYYGAHSTANMEDGYLGSGKLILKAIAKYGKQAFSRQVIATYNSREELFEAEKQLVTKEVTEDPNTYNLAIGGLGGGPEVNGFTRKGIPHDATIRHRLSELAQARALVYKPTEATRAKMRANNFARRSPGAQRAHAKLAGQQSWTGSDAGAHKAKISASLRSSAKRIQIRVSCPHCGKLGGSRAMKRWHFDNCKLGTY